MVSRINWWFGSKIFLKFSFSLLYLALATEVLDIPLDLSSEYETKMTLSS